MIKNLRIEIYGGLNEVGGNKIVINDKYSQTSILLDFGKSFGRYNNYYDYPQQHPTSIEELKKFGIIPDIPNLYSIGITEDKFSFDKDPEPDISAVFISHAHLDHIGHLSLLTRKLKVYLGECTKSILDAISKTAWPIPIDNRYAGIPEISETFKTGDTIRIDSLFVHPIHVDHSVPGSYGFVVETSSGTIVYTGDLRLHGESDLTFDFIEKAKQFDPDILIIESTHIDFAGYSSEYEVYTKISTLVNRATNTNFIAMFSRVDYDRFYSFYKIAITHKIPLIIDFKRWIFLEHIIKCPRLKKRVDMNRAPIYILLNKKTYSSSEKAILKELLDTIPDRILIPSKLLNKIRISKDLKRRIGSCKTLENFIRTRRFIYAPSYIMPNTLSLIGPPPNTIFIMASSEPITEEAEIQFEKLMNWLEAWGIPIYHIHASGHATPIDLKYIIEEIKPKYIIPIHGTRPNLLANFVGRDKYRWIIHHHSDKLLFEY